MFKVYAQCDPSAANLNLADCYTTGMEAGSRPVSEVFTDPATLINILVSNIFLFSGLIFLVLLVYSGYLYISDTTKGKEQAQEIITNAMKGFILMFTAYWIVQIVISVTGVQSIF